MNARESIDRGAALDAALGRAQADYAVRNPESQLLHRHACAYLPGGNTRTVLYFEPFPLRIARGFDQFIEDVDGHRYLDLLGEYSAGLYGHSNPLIRIALERTLADGISFGAHNHHEIKLAQAICARFPGIERIRFTNSGSEANLLALTLARHFTGRDRVLVFDGGYHGGVLYFGGGGSPVNAPFDFVVVPYNDAAAATGAIKRHRAELACVLIEPMLGSGGCIPGEPEFLHGVADACKASGALMILDEVMTSRLSSGGRQKLLGLRPDLTTLGKYLGGGLSFGAFGGRAEIMELFDPSHPDALPHAGTFNNNVLSMAAGHAGLTEVFTPEAAAALNARGDRLRDSLNALFRARAVPLQATGLGSLLNIHASAAPVSRPTDLAASDDRIKALLFFDLLADGIYIARRGYMALSLMVGDEDLQRLHEALERFIERRRELLDAA